MPHTRKEILQWGQHMADRIFHRKPQEPEEVTIKGWIARDKDGFLCLYTVKPWRLIGSNSWHTGAIPTDAKIPTKYFPFVQWSDPEPTLVTITIKIEK